MAFTSIARDILREAEALDQYIQTNNLPQPSLDADGPARTVFATKESSSTHASLLANTHKLHLLAQGPTAPWLGTLNGPAGDTMTTAAVYRFNIVDHVPIGAEASFDEVAKKCGLALRDFQLIVRYAMTNYIFCEPRPGFIAHTAASKVLAENKLIRALMGMGTTEIFPALSKELEVLEIHPGSQEPTESSWSLAHNARTPMFEELAVHHPDRAATFAFAMESLAKLFKPSVLTEAYDWASLGSANLVDVGGGKGLACQNLAQQFPKLSFIVQDLEATAKAGRNQLPVELKDRITFTTHDFFTPQPLKDADVYFFRAIMHDWPDKYCIRILQSLVPAMKKGARVIIFDPHTPDPLTSGPWQERQARASNLRMKVFFNSHDRQAWEWEGMFAKADSRFRVNAVTVHARELNNAAGPLLVLVEAIWEG